MHRRSPPWPQVERLRDLAEAAAPGAVRFERGLTDTQLGDRYRASHALLSLSEHEGLCVPLLEAFALGVPVVGRPAGGITEVAGDAAVLVDAADPAVGGGAAAPRRHRRRPSAPHARPRFPARRGLRGPRGCAPPARGGRGGWSAV